MPPMKLRTLPVLVLMLVLGAGVATAKRPAAATEKTAIFKGLKPALRSTEPVSCWAYTVSTKDRTWAYVQIAPGKLGEGPCEFHGADPGRHYLHATAGKWKDVVSGSGFACSDFTHAKMPTKVIKDLDGRSC